MLEPTQRRVADRAQEEAQRRTDEAKKELGRVAFETLEDYFPAEAKARQRRYRALPFVAGVAVGILLGHFLRR